MIRYSYYLAILAFIALVGSQFDQKTGFTSLIRFGETWQNKRLSALHGLPISIAANSNGYDGQFYAQIAVDPLLREAELVQVIDAPAYRARRILAPAVAALLGFGIPWWTLQAYSLLNVMCWLILAWLLRTWTTGNDWKSFARWAGCLFGIGVLDSVRQSLVDLPALVLLSLAVKAHSPNQLAKSTLWLALGNLAKETTLVGALALNISSLCNGQQRRRVLTGLTIAVLPFVAWWGYVYQRFGATLATEGFGNFTWPFFGLFTHAKLCWNELHQGNFDGRYSFGLLAIIGLFTQVLTLWYHRDTKSSWWRIGAAYSLLLPFLSLWVWSGYWAACRAVLPLTIAFNLVLPTGRSFWPLWIAGNLSLLHAVWRFL